jgi:predicted Zn-dependent protease
MIRSLCLASLLLASAPVGGARGDPLPAPQAPAGIGPVDPTIAALDAQLLHAADANGAQAIADRLETRRMARLSPTVRLMLRRGQRELAANKPHEALGDISDAIDLQPEQGPLWRERAMAQAMNGDADAAITDLGGALSRDPSDILSWSALSSIEEHHGEPRQAYEAWERVLRLDPKIDGGASRLLHLHHRMLGDPT